MALLSNDSIFEFYQASTQHTCKYSNTTRTCELLKAAESQRPRYTQTAEQCPCLTDRPSHCASSIHSTCFCGYKTNNLPGPSTIQFTSPIGKEQLNEFLQAVCPRLYTYQHAVQGYPGIQEVGINQKPHMISCWKTYLRYAIHWKSKTRCWFILKARQADGKYYPSSTRRNTLAALFLVMQQHHGTANNVSFKGKCIPCYNVAIVY